MSFNIYFCDNIDIASYADDTTPYVSDVTLDSTVKLQKKQQFSYSHNLIITK